ncbi:MAG: ArgE/DapE family deacylase [Calditrichaceae bacterium]|nr:ArgE/DapE family deacylase [Calditrichia bacterium]NUQ44297.1 ArgE/DapE family deacylase [Calditrichaceae bacterium]
MKITIDQKYLHQTLREMVQINSINPSLAPGAPGEAEIAAYAAEALSKLNAAVQVHEPLPGRASVVGILRGSGGGKSLMLNAHLDTVGIEGMPEPFSAAIRNGKLYGRGAYDMKGSAAACLAAAKALRDAGVALRGDLLIALVADEEYESVGTQEILKHCRPDAAIVTEPTQLNICLAHKGFIWLEVETLGRAAHGSRFEEGVDANMRMGRFLAQLDVLEQLLRSGKAHPLVGPPSLHAAMLKGGSGWSTYAEKCTLSIERRTIPGESEETVLRQIRGMIDQLSATDPTFKASVRVTCAREAFEVEKDAEIVQTLKQASEAVTGRAPEFFGDTPWMDSALLSAAGVETVVMGPSGAGAHAREEWVELRSVEIMAEILAQTALKYCRVQG